MVLIKLPVDIQIIDCDKSSRPFLDKVFFQIGKDLVSLQDLLGKLIVYTDVRSSERLASALHQMFFKCLNWFKIGLGLHRQTVRQTELY